MDHLRYILIASILCSCVGQESYQVPELNCEQQAITSNISVKQLLAITTNIAQKIDEDLIIEGYVVSSDVSGNFYKSIAVQSVDNEYGFLIKINDFNLYTIYEVGRKISVKLKGLYHIKENGQLVIGIQSGKSIGAISAGLHREHIIRSCDFKEEKELVKEIELLAITDVYLNQLVEIDSVQFITESIHKNLYEPEKTLGSATNHVIEDAQGYNLIIRTSAYSDLINVQIPNKGGKIRGILSKYRDDYQLFLRSQPDMQLTEDRILLEKISLAALSKKEQDTPLTENRYVEGIITLSGYRNGINSQNIGERLAILQDDTTAIALYFDTDQHELKEGDRVKIYTAGYNIDTYGGQLRLETLDFNGKSSTGQQQIIVLNSDNLLPTPKPVTIKELIDNKYPLQRIEVQNVQLSGEYRGLSFSGKKSITDCENAITLRTYTKAIFSKNTVPEGNGNIIGICNGAKEIYAQNTSWITTMTQPRCDDTTLFFEQDFETIPLAPVVFNLTDWYNISVNGGVKKWEIQSFGGNQYLQLSAYKAEEDMEVWLVTPPIDMDTNSDEYLRFRTKDAFYNGDVLAIYISSDFDGTNISTATWTKLNATISKDTSSGYAPIFKDSGKIDLSAYQGNISIGFRYTGDTDGVTTTVQIDEIQIFGKPNTP